MVHRQFNLSDSLEQIRSFRMVDHVASTDWVFVIVRLPERDRTRLWRRSRWREAVIVLAPARYRTVNENTYPQGASQPEVARPQAVYGATSSLPFGVENSSRGPERGPLRTVARIRIASRMI